MPVAQHFVLFQRERMVSAITVPFFPSALTFQGNTYVLSRRSLIDFNHLIRGTTLVGFDFLNSADGGDDFLSSQFIHTSRNVELANGVLAIWLGSKEAAESDQGSFMGAHLFQTPEHDYMIVLPCLLQYYSEFGFDLIMQNGPSPSGSEEKKKLDSYGDSNRVA